MRMAECHTGPFRAKVNRVSNMRANELHRLNGLRRRVSTHNAAYLIYASQIGLTICTTTTTTTKQQCHNRVGRDACLPETNTNIIDLPTPEMMWLHMRFKVESERDDEEMVITHASLGATIILSVLLV